VPNYEFFIATTEKSRIFGRLLDLLYGFASSREGKCSVQMEKKEFSAFFQRHYAYVCASVNLLVRDTAVSEDLVQEAFVKFWETKPVLLRDGAAPGYVKRMAINNALMYLRSKKTKEKQLIEFSAGQSASRNPTEEEIFNRESQQKLTTALQQLPRGCREVFMLSRYEQMTYHEIAEQLNISTKTVENQILKALKILRESLLAMALCYIF
jgi:RNA polymerase sigma-70 factor (ECF subfamily)